MGKRTQWKDFHKEMFHVYGGKCLSRKGVHNWIYKFSQGRSKIANDARPGAEVAERSQKLTCCGFRRTGKAMGQVYQMLMEDMQRNKCFSRLEYRVFYVLYPFVTYLLTIPLILVRNGVTWKPGHIFTYTDFMGSHWCATRGSNWYYRYRRATWPTPKPYKWHWFRNYYLSRNENGWQAKIRLQVKFIEKPLW
jgi:hypothetical protein